MNEEIEAPNAAQKSKASKLPIWFSVVSILALLWFLMDLSAFVMRIFMFDNMLNGMPENQRSLYLSMPSWVNFVFTLEVFGGLFGSVNLILKKKWALVFFIISIVGVLVQTFYVYFISEAISLMGVPAVVMPLLAIIIGLGMIYFTKLAISRKWIN